MEKKDFGKAIRDLNEEMLNEIRQIVKEAEGTINIPYYYDDYSYNEDIVNELTEDEYDVREGDSQDNLQVALIGDWDMREDVVVVAVSLGNHYNKNAVLLINEEQNSYEIDCNDNSFMINEVLEALRKINE